MKKQLQLLAYCILLTAYCLAQGPNAIWEDQINGGYKYVRFNSVTGVKTTVANLPPMVGFVAADASASNPDMNYYYFIAQTNTNKILYTLNRSSGAIVYSPVITNTVVGIEYNCADSMLYGIQVNGNSYNFVKVDPVTATTTTVAGIANMMGYVGGTFSLDLAAQTYTYRALTSTVFVLRTLNVKTGAVVANNTFADNIRGMKYSPTDNKTYGLWDDNGVYKLEDLDVMTGTHSTVMSYTAIIPGFYGENTSINQNGEYTFRGFDANNNPALFTLDVTTGAILYQNSTSDNAVGFEEPTCVTASTSLNAISTERSPLFYPNPASNIIHLEEPAILYNSLGEKVLEIKTKTADLSSMPRGIYFVKSYDEGSSLFTKLMLQ